MLHACASLEVLTWTIFCWYFLTILRATKECDNEGDCSSESTSYDGVFWCLGYKTCASSHFTILQDVQCRGDSSCMNTYNESSGSSTIGIFCEAYSSCFDATPVSSVYCVGSNICQSTKISFTGNYQCFYLGGLHSFNHGVLKSNSSLSSYEWLVSKNERTITTLSYYATFDMYNSSIYSNNNDVDIYMYGYCSGYGLKVYCTQTEDSCFVRYSGNSCFNLTLICDSSISSKNCVMYCIDDQDSLCQESEKTWNNWDVSYIDTVENNISYKDYMVQLIDDMILEHGD